MGGSVFVASFRRQENQSGCKVQVQRDRGGSALPRAAIRCCVNIARSIKASRLLCTLPERRLVHLSSVQFGLPTPLLVIFSLLESH